MYTLVKTNQAQQWVILMICVAQAWASSVGNLASWDWQSDLAKLVLMPMHEQLVGGFSIL